MFWGEKVWAKIGKQAAARAYDKAVQTPEEADQINEAAGKQGKAILAHAKEHSHSVLHPATWLNQGRYEDEPPKVDGEPDWRAGEYDESKE